MGLVYKVMGDTGYDARDLWQMDEDWEIVLWIKKTISISNKEGGEEKKEDAVRLMSKIKNVLALEARGENYTNQYCYICGILRHEEM